MLYIYFSLLARISLSIGASGRSVAVVALRCAILPFDWIWRSWVVVNVVGDRSRIYLQLHIIGGVGLVVESVHSAHLSNRGVVDFLSLVVDSVQVAV